MAGEFVHVAQGDEQATQLTTWRMVKDDWAALLAVKIEADIDPMYPALHVKQLVELMQLAQESEQGTQILWLLR